MNMDIVAMGPKNGQLVSQSFKKVFHLSCWHTLHTVLVKKMVSNSIKLFLCSNAGSPSHVLRDSALSVTRVVCRC